VFVLFVKEDTISFNWCSPSRESPSGKLWVRGSHPWRLGWSIAWWP